MSLRLASRSAPRLLVPAEGDNPRTDAGWARNAATAPRGSFPPPLPPRSGSAPFEVRREEGGTRRSTNGRSVRGGSAAPHRLPPPPWPAPSRPRGRMILRRLRGPGRAERSGRWGPARVRGAARGRARSPRGALRAGRRLGRCWPPSPPGLALPGRCQAGGGAQHRPERSLGVSRPPLNYVPARKRILNTLRDGDSTPPWGAHSRA